MLKIYTTPDLVSTDIIIKDNDRYFHDQFMKPSSKREIDDKMKELMLEIDGSTYIGSQAIKTRYGAIKDLDFLSTGCKTAINVYSSPDKVIDTLECGGNAAVEIMKLNKGSAIITGMPAAECDAWDELHCEIIGENKTIVCTSFNECIDAFEEVREWPSY